MALSCPTAEWTEKWPHQSRELEVSQYTLLIAGATQLIFTF